MYSLRLMVEADDNGCSATVNIRIIMLRSFFNSDCYAECVALIMLRATSLCRQYLPWDSEIIQNLNVLLC